METQVRTPHAVFMMPQRLLVPLFHRPYVWNEELQWEPLWKETKGDVVNGGHDGAGCEEAGRGGVLKVE